VSIIGKYADLKVVKLVDFGVYLEGEHEEVILLPNRYVPGKVNIDEKIHVFIYRDSEDRLIATTEKPYATVGDFAYLRVKSVNQMGAFLDWGLTKDLMVPFSNQKVKMEEGRSYLVYVYLDETTGRIVATAKLNKVILSEDLQLEVGQEVDVLVGHRGELGHVAVINNAGLGMIYKNEIFGPIREGETRKAYVKKIRPDGKIDLSLQAQGYQKEIPQASDKVLELLKAEEGFLPLNDKSSPEAIYEMLHMSKKNFKKAIGLLYKEKIIKIESTGIYLNPNKNH
jgi:predicted RNA-binding protein (virulence factor B family)